MYGTKLNWGVF